MECRLHVFSNGRASLWPASGQSPARRATVKRRLPRVCRVTSRLLLKSTFSCYHCCLIFPLSCGWNLLLLRHSTRAFPDVRGQCFSFFLSFSGRSVGSAFFRNPLPVASTRRVLLSSLAPGGPAPIFSARPSFPKPARAIFPPAPCARLPVSPPICSWPWRATNGALREWSSVSEWSHRLLFVSLGVKTTMSFTKIFHMSAFDRANSDAATDLHPS
jgi:hypothetical protein